MKVKKVAVIVAGSWGTALASVLCENATHVTIWTRNLSQVNEINMNHENKRFLKGIKLSKTLVATASIEEATASADAIILAAPTSAMREVVRQMKPYLQKEVLIIHAAKGFEMETLKRMSTVISEELPEHDPQKVVVLSGPSHAEEVILKCPTTVVVASDKLSAAETAQDLLINPYFRVYTNPDIIGVEMSGALKNIIAICAGLTDGLGFGDNAKAALITRGLAEISRLGVAMGANPLTFAGLAGVGDLIVTCTSKHSRNFRAGSMLARGDSIENVLKKMGMVVEGIKTTKAAYILAKQQKVDMPITNELYQVLFENKVPKDAVNDLMGRNKTKELEEAAKAKLLNQG